MPFVKGVPKTEAEKQAMRDGWARKKAKEQFEDKVVLPRYLETISKI